MPTFFEALNELMAAEVPLVAVTVVYTIGSAPQDRGAQMIVTDDGFVVLVTRSHTTDKPILIEILRTRTFPYLGVIGSDAKAAVLRRDIAEAGLPEDAKRAFFCPIGLDLGSNHPYEIAVSVVAQMIRIRDLLC